MLSLTTCGIVIQYCPDVTCNAHTFRTRSQAKPNAFAHTSKNVRMQRHMQANVFTCTRSHAHANMRMRLRCIWAVLYLDGWSCCCCGRYVHSRLISNSMVRQYPTAIVTMPRWNRPKEALETRLTRDSMARPVNAVFGFWLSHCVNLERNLSHIDAYCTAAAQQY